MNMNTNDYIDNVATELNKKALECLNNVSAITKQLNSFIDGNLEISDKGIEERLDDLIGNFTITLDLPMPIDLHIIRARKFEEGKDEKPCFEDVSKLSYPPEGFAPLGRCNKKGKSIFYACVCVGESACRNNVAFSEVNALAGERINLLKSKSTKTINLRYVGIWNHVVRNVKPYFLHELQWEAYLDAYTGMEDKFHKDLLGAYYLCDAFFADILRRKGSERLYKVTSTLTAMYLESAEADGILYTSVKSEGSPVVALSTEAVDAKLVHISTESYEVLKDYGYAQYSTKILYKGSIEEGDTNITWYKIK